VLGVPPLIGRVFTADDDQHGGGRSGPVAVISYAFWQANFGGDPKALGKTVKLDRHAFQIVGVTPPWFKGLDVDQGYGVAIPIGCEPLLHTDRSALAQRSWWWLGIVGRLKPGETAQRAEALMNSIAPEIARATLPPNWDAAGKKRYLQRLFQLRPAATGFSAMGTRYKKALFTLMAVVGLVLLIACANIANLLLARSAARQREMSIRLAIGAARSRVIRQLLTESLLLAFLGAAGGLLFSIWGGRLMLRLLTTANTELQLDLSPDLHLLGFTAGVAVLTGILFGLAPALRATRAAPNQVLKENARGTLAGSSRFTLGKALVTSQVALSLTLLVGAGLFLGTFRNLLTLDAGFNRHSVMLVQASLPQAHIPKAQSGPLFDKILTSVREIHGVRSASNSVLTPMGNMFWNEDLHPEGYQAKPAAEDTLTWLNRVSPGYFETMGTPVLMGRDFSSRDTAASPLVMVLAESAARQFWGGANPIGKTVATDRDGASGLRDIYEVIGIVKDAKYGKLDEKNLKTAYIANSQNADPFPETNYELRYEGSAEALIPSVRAAIAGVNPDVSLEFRDLEVQVNDSLLQTRIVALLSSFFGLLALLLSMIGLYGVLSYTATQRRGEIGIRMALGAAQSSVIWLILRDVLIMLAIGLILGAAVSLAAGRLVSSLLYGLRPTDPVTLAMAAAVLGICAAFAGYLPARRASRMDPMAALRDE
jgi:putative ABC transport system permease protein